MKLKNDNAIVVVVCLHVSLVFFSFCTLLRNHFEFSKWCYLSHSTFHLKFKIPIFSYEDQLCAPPPLHFFLLSVVQSICMFTLRSDCYHQ